MRIYHLAESMINKELKRLKLYLSDPGLQDLSCVYNAKKKLEENDFYGTIKALKVDCDKIRMINRDLYNYIGNIAIPMSQEVLNKWHKVWDEQENPKN